MRQNRYLRVSREVETSWPGEGNGDSLCVFVLRYYDGVNGAMYASSKMHGPNFCDLESRQANIAVCGSRCQKIADSLEDTLRSVGRVANARYRG